jgi:hypothetical protein
MNNEQTADGPVPLAGITLSPEKAAILQQLYLQVTTIGPQTTGYVSKLIQTGRLPEPMLGACRGIVRLARLCGHHRMEAACKRALEGNKYNLKTIKNILNSNLDTVEEIPPVTTPVISEHENLRGSSFFE